MDSTVQKVRDFHGHLCAGLTIGIRAAQVALREIGPHSADEEVVAVVETDMCAVDATQVLTGCTFGKGNLIHLTPLVVVVDEDDGNVDTGDEDDGNDTQPTLPPQRTPAPTKPPIRP
jgi:hypothetical protein